MQTFEKRGEIDIYQYKISKVFMYLFVGLVIAAFTSYIASTNTWILKNYTIFIILWIVVSILLIFAINFFARDQTVSTILYLIYCSLEGVALSPIFLIYTKTSIFLVFLATGLICLILSIYAKYTKHDFRQYGFVLLIATIIGLVVSIINMFFMKSSIVSTVLNFVFVIIFSLWFIYDIQIVEDLLNLGYSEAAIALNLFIDIVGLFINLLELFGEEK